MKDAIRSSLRPLRSNLETLILFSLWITLAKMVFHLAMALFTPSVLALMDLFLVMLLLAQIFAFITRKKIAWILSAIQTVSIYFLSVGTFSYLFSYLLSPITLDGPSHAYLVPACILASEVWKTVFFHRTCKN